MKQELLTIRKQMSSSPFSGVRVFQSLVFCVVFCVLLFAPLSVFHLAMVGVSPVVLRLLNILAIPSVFSLMESSNILIQSVKICGHLHIPMARCFIGWFVIVVLYCQWCLVVSHAIAESYDKKPSTHSHKMQTWRNYFNMQCATSVWFHAWHQ